MCKELTLEEALEIRYKILGISPIIDSRRNSVDLISNILAQR